MNKEFWQILFIIAMVILLFAGGIQGVVRKDKIKNRADYILSVGQIIGGIIFSIFLIVSFFLRLTGNWPLVK